MNVEQIKENLKDHVEVINNLAKSCLDEYLYSALWSSTDSDGNCLDEKYSVQDFTKETRIRALEDLKKFVGYLVLHYGVEILDEIPKHRYGKGGFAHDFWLTRAGHGAGFWDGDWDWEFKGKNMGKDILTHASKLMGERNVYECGNNRHIMIDYA